MGDDVATIAKSVNKHHCSKTCFKKGGFCRFKYPKPPSPQTIIVQPLDEKSQEKRKQRLAKDSIMIQKVTTLAENEEVISEIMQKYNKEEESESDFQINRKERIKEICRRADVNFNDYLTALGNSNSGYKVILARDIDETMINPFNPEMLRAWNGNMDLQPVLDFFAVVTYVSDYYSKDDTGLMDILNGVLKDENGQDLKDKMKTLANAFLMMRQIGEAEAVFRLIKTMNLSKSNIKCEFVATGPKEERSVFLQKATEEQLKQGIPVIQLPNRDGYFYAKPDLWERYLRRPSVIKDMCFAQFAKMYRKPDSNKKDNDEDNDNDNIDETIEEPIYDDNDKFHFIMTSERDQVKPLPKMIELRTTYPSDPRFMVKRTFPAALRFHMVKIENDPKRYMLNEIMLYRPLDNEVKDEDIQSLYNEKVDDELRINIVKRQVMEYLEGVTEARYHAEQLKKELNIDLDEIAAANLDPQGFQDNEQCDLEGADDHEDFQHLDPDMLTIPNEDKEESKKHKSLFREIDLPTNDELKQSIRSLDPYQREVLDTSIKYARQIVKSRKPPNKYPKGPLINVSGGAGAGNDIKLIHKEYLV